MREFTYTTQRTFTVLAEDEDQAARLAEAELHDGEVILSVEEEGQ